MSTIDPNSTATLNKILEKIGVKSNDDASSKKKDTLGQSDFLKLMTTQLQIRILLPLWKMVIL